MEAERHYDALLDGLRPHFPANSHELQTAFAEWVIYDLCPLKLPIIMTHLNTPYGPASRTMFEPERPPHPDTTSDQYTWLSRIDCKVRRDIRFVGKVSIMIPRAKATLSEGPCLERAIALYGTGPGMHELIYDELGERLLTALKTWASSAAA